MTQAISTLTWQEQSDSSQPLANYTLAFGTDPVWQFQLPSTYHFAPINPRGVTIDNSQGAGTINLVSAGLTVNVLPFSRQDIDLSNVSQLITFNFQQTVGQPTIAPYSLPIVFWMKRPSGAQQNQLAINTAVQSAIVGNVLGNMQPIINSGFTEFVGPPVPSVGVGTPLYTQLEGWMFTGAAAPNAWSASQQSNPIPQAPFGLRFTPNTAPNAITQLQFGTALTTADSIQFQGQQVTLAFDLFCQQLGSNGTFTYQLIYGTGTDQNIFTPFTGQTVAAVGTVTNGVSGFFSRRLTLTTSSPLPSTIKQLGILIQYAPGFTPINDSITICRPQIDFGTIAQQFRTVPQLMERDRCLGFFQRVNGEGVASFLYGNGFSASATINVLPLYYVKKRAIPIITASGSFVDGFGNVTTANAFPTIGLDRAQWNMTVGAGGMSANLPKNLFDNSAGASFVDVNARM